MKQKKDNYTKLIDILKEKFKDKLIIMVTHDKKLAKEIENINKISEKNSGHFKPLPQDIIIKFLKIIDSTESPSLLFIFSIIIDFSCSLFSLLIIILYVF